MIMSNPTATKKCQLKLNILSETKHTILVNTKLVTILVVSKLIRNIVDSQQVSGFSVVSLVAQLVKAQLPVEQVADLILTVSKILGY